MSTRRYHSQWCALLCAFLISTLVGCSGDESGGDGSTPNSPTYTIGGTVSGLVGSGLVLQNNGGDDLAITADGSFSFATSVVEGSNYSVTVLNQPGSPSQTCNVASGNGAVSGANVTSIALTCSPVLSVSATQPRVLTFSWQDTGADYYRLLKNPDGVSGYTQLGGDITATSVDEAIAVHLQDWVSASYIVQACVTATSSCTDSAPITATSAMINAIGYLKASNTGESDQFGYRLALSGDGSTLAVGALYERSAATGVDGNQADNSAPAAGAVYLFTRSGASWSQQAYLKASNTGAGDSFGGSLALSDDGNTLAVGASWESSAVTGIDGDQTDNSAPLAGAVYLFTRSGTAWGQQAYLKASNTDAYDKFGSELILSDDGNTLAVGAIGENSAAIGIDGDQSDNTAPDAGAVYLFTRSGASWSQQAYLKASNTGAGDSFGGSLSLSSDGSTLAVGARLESSAATAIDGNQSDNSAAHAGAVYLFTRSGTSWSQQAYLKASNTQADDQFGNSLSLSDDGNTLAVGARLESSAATAIDGNQSDNSAAHAGAVYLFTRSGTNWSQHAYLKASNTQADDQFGSSLVLSGDGNTLAVAAIGEDSAAIGVNSSQIDNSADFVGAAYLFTRTGASWSQQAYLKASNTETNDGFGWSLALSDDGNTMAVGSYGEDSAATGVNGNQSDNSAPTAGSVYLF